MKIETICKLLAKGAGVDDPPPKKEREKKRKPLCEVQVFSNFSDLGRHFGTTFICCGNSLPPRSRENTYCLYREDSDKDAK